MPDRPLGSNQPQPGRTVLADLTTDKGASHNALWRPDAPVELRWLRNDVLGA